jgi:predicted CXXCH cytochrome family protein
MLKLRVVASSSCVVAVVSLALALWPAVAQSSNAPLPEGAEIGWSHAPFEMGECGLCHESDDPNDPGPIAGEVNDLCFGCHVETQEAMEAAAVSHAAAVDDCTSCHNPHNSARRRLLNAESPGLCATCHEDIWQEATQSPVQHEAVKEGRACLNCHGPHATNVEHLLNELPYDLCVDCHGVAGMSDDQGKGLTDFARLLADNPSVHGPVAAEDCSACHETHGGSTFRMLAEAYPAKFYAPFDTENYSLCFTCHNEAVVTEASTTTLTGFRDGSKNLHFVHVNKQDRGRTCRACHEVHAAPQDHLIRDGVPYGRGDWVLKINYTRDDNGGTCEKTCHGALTYDRNRQPDGEAESAL